MAQQSGAISIDERELIQRAAGQDRAALSAVYGRYAQPLYAIAFRILGHQVDAEEELIELMQLIWHRIVPYDPGAGPVDVWLFGLMRKRALERMRARKAQGRRPGVDSGDLPGGGLPPTPAVGRLMADRQAVIKAAMATLPAVQREVVELAYYRGFNQPEIALLTDLPPPEVREQAKQGLERLVCLLRHLWGPDLR